MKYQTYTSSSSQVFLFGCAAFPQFFYVNMDACAHHAFITHTQFERSSLPTSCMFSYSTDLCQHKSTFCVIWAHHERAPTCGWIRVVQNDDIYRMDEIKSLSFHIMFYRLYRGVAKYIEYLFIIWVTDLYTPPTTRRDERQNEHKTRSSLLNEGLHL